MRIYRILEIASKIGICSIQIIDPIGLNVEAMRYSLMSESKQNSIGNRIRDHHSGQSGNPGLRFVGVSEQILTTDSVAAVLNKRRFTMVDSP